MPVTPGSIISYVSGLAGELFLFGRGSGNDLVQGKAWSRMCTQCCHPEQNPHTIKRDSSFSTTNGSNPKWSRGVTVSTLDSESSDRGSNPRETCFYLS